FKATLEELEYADVLIHVIDASDPERDAHMRVVDKLISELAGENIPVILCYNKCDLADPDDLPRVGDFVTISAKDGRGVDTLLRKLEQTLDRGKRHVRLLLPYSMGGQVEKLHETAKVLSCEYTDEGIALEAVCDAETYGRLRDYVTEER
ncbi:MAG: GTPase HflX, partial [Oscillospiraceae bacterium]|nr:GTPase HflX [Oscillospiraceae bacterium]